MTMNLIAGFLGGMLVMWIIRLVTGRKKKAEYEKRLQGLKDELSALKLKRQEAETKNYRHELEIKKHRDLAILFPELVKHIFSARQPDDLARQVAKAVCMLTDCEKIAVFLADVRGGKLGLVHVEGLEDVLSRPLVVNVGEGHVGFVAETGLIFDKNDVPDMSELTKVTIKKTAIPGFVPDLAVPMISQGVLYGVICLVDIPITSSFPRERLISIAAVGAAAMEGIRLLSRFESAADLDLDTGLPKAGRLESILSRELERVRRFASPLAVMELVVDKGSIEDRYRAREFMSMAANNLKAKMRNIDIAVRTGPDRIMLLLPGTGQDGIESVMHKLIDGLPALRDDSGEPLGTVRMRYEVVKPGSVIEAGEVLEKLMKKALISSSS